MYFVSSEVQAHCDTYMGKRSCKGILFCTILETPQIAFLVMKGAKAARELSLGARNTQRFHSNDFQFTLKSYFVQS